MMDDLSRRRPDPRKKRRGENGTEFRKKVRRSTTEVSIKSRKFADTGEKNPNVSTGGRKKGTRGE